MSTSVYSSTEEIYAGHMSIATCPIPAQTVSPNSSK